MMAVLSVTVAVLIAYGASLLYKQQVAKQSNNLNM